MAKSCVICAGDETSGEQLVKAPCLRHWICTDDVGSFFERAAESESLFPPKCCGQILLLDNYESFVPFDVQWAFRMKEQGEYSVMAKYRVYCANPVCSKFLDPSTYAKDPSTDISYAVCQDETCKKPTCTSCKTMLDGFEGHICEQNEEDRKFQETAWEKGFQECPTCASTVELTEACNHISCQCGTEFCYICGDEWQDLHACPHYGPAIYDEEGYNQDGYHRISGLNREARTRHEQARRDGQLGLVEVDEDDGEEDDENDSDDDENESDNDENDGGEDVDTGAIDLVLRHFDPDIRATFEALPHGERELFLINLRIQLLEERGMIFADSEEDEEKGDTVDEQEGNHIRESDDVLESGHDGGLVPASDTMEGVARQNDGAGDGEPENENAERRNEEDAAMQALDATNGNSS